jgi:hypothetical protein
MQQNDPTVVQQGGDPAAHRDRRGISSPVAAICEPQDWTEAEPPRGAQAGRWGFGAVDASTEAAPRLPRQWRHNRDTRPRRRRVACAGDAAVAPAVYRELMAASHQFPADVGMPAELLPDHEERRVLEWTSGLGPSSNVSATWPALMPANRGSRTRRSGPMAARLGTPW